MNHSATSGMYVPTMSAFLNRWFSNYEDAKTSLKTEGGYLFPFENQFFVTESEAVRELGLDPNDPDWALIGWDWARPLDEKAWHRLQDKRMHLPTSQNDSPSSARKGIAL